MKRTYRWDLSLHKLVEIEKQVPGPTIWIIRDIDPYLDENMGHMPIPVNSRRHRNDLLKERGLSIL